MKHFTLRTVFSRVFADGEPTANTTVKHQLLSSLRGRIKVGLLFLLLIIFRAPAWGAEISWTYSGEGVAPTIANVTWDYTGWNGGFYVANSGDTYFGLQITAPNAQITQIKFKFKGWCGEFSYAFSSDGNFTSYSQMTPSDTYNATCTITDNIPTNSTYFRLERDRTSQNWWYFTITQVEVTYTTGSTPPTPTPSFDAEWGYVGGADGEGTYETKNLFPLEEDGYVSIIGDIKLDNSCGLDYTNDNTYHYATNVIQTSTPIKYIKFSNGYPANLTALNNNEFDTIAVAWTNADNGNMTVTFYDGDGNGKNQIGDAQSVTGNLRTERQKISILSAPSGAKYVEFTTTADAHKGMIVYLAASLKSDTPTPTSNVPDVKDLTASYTNNQVQLSWTNVNLIDLIANDWASIDEGGFSKNDDGSVTITAASSGWGTRKGAKVSFPPISNVVSFDFEYKGTLISTWEGGGLLPVAINEDNQWWQQYYVTSADWTHVTHTPTNILSGTTFAGTCNGFGWRVEANTTGQNNFAVKNLIANTTNNASIFDDVIVMRKEGSASTSISDGTQVSLASFKGHTLTDDLTPTAGTTYYTVFVKSGSDYSAGVSASVTPVVTTYTVTYAKGDDNVTGDVPTQESKAADATFTVADKGNLAWTGHTFTGWKDQDNQDVAVGSTYTMPAKAVTLTAQWTAAIIPVTGITLDKYELSLTVGGTETLTATVTPDNATDKTVTWSSGNETVATVDENGEVTAIGVGTAAIYVKSHANQSILTSCPITVTAAPTPTTPTIPTNLTELNSTNYKTASIATNPITWKDASYIDLANQNNVTWEAKIVPGIYNISPEYGAEQWGVHLGLEIVYDNTIITSLNFDQHPSTTPGLENYWNSETKAWDLSSLDANKTYTIRAKDLWTGMGSLIRLKHIIFATATTHNVIFNANGGSGTMSTKMGAVGYEYVIPKCTFKAPAGKDFDKWTSSNVTITDGKFEMPNQEVTLTANWKDIQYAKSIDFMQKDTQAVVDVAKVLSRNNYTMTPFGDTQWDSGGDKYSGGDCGLKSEYGDREFSFWVPAGKQVTIQLGTWQGNYGGGNKPELYANGKKLLDLKTSQQANDPIITSEDTKFVIKIVNPMWSLIQKITIDDAPQNTFKTAGDWSTTTNWSLGHVATATEDVIIAANCSIPDETAAEANRVVIKENVKLTISSQASLVVAGTIQSGDNYTSNLSATTADQILIQSSEDGNGALIFNNEDGNAKATVEYYSIASGAPTDTKWQWATTPFNDVTDIAENYSGAYMAPWDNSTKNWGAFMSAGDGMQAFRAYCISRASAGLFTMTGTLASTKDQNPDITYSSTVKASRAGLNLIGNSWTAPINISAWNIDDFVEVEPTIIILNTSMDINGTGTVSSDLSGQYVSIPVKSSELMESAMHVIPAMQAFQVRTEDEATAASVVMNYDQLVRKADANIEIQPMRAPSRKASLDINYADIVTLRINIKGANYGDFLYLFEHPQFTNGYDRGWDGEKILGALEAAQLYVIQANKDYSVSAQPTISGTQLGFYRGDDETYTITFDYNGIDRLFLFDANTGIYTEVKNGNSYTFSSYTFNLEKRFTLTDTNPHESIITDYNEVKANEAPFKFIQDEHLYIRNHHRLFDGQGKLVK